jgi:hypothetical protein
MSLIFPVRGCFHWVLRGELKIFLNGKQLELDDDSEPELFGSTREVELQPGDRVVLKVESRKRNPCLRIGFISTDRCHTLPLRVKHLKRLDDVRLRMINSARIKASNIGACHARPDRTCVEMWSKWCLPLDSSEWLWGPVKGKPMQLAFEVDRTKFQVVSPEELSTRQTLKPQRADPGVNVFRKKGQAWEFRFASGDMQTLLPCKGAAYLHLLLSNSGKAFSAADMAYQVAKNTARFALGDAGEQSDKEAIRAYKAKVVELREEIDEAKANNDEGRQIKAEEELAAISEQIQKDRGLRGRSRKAKDDRERFRMSVGAAIRRTLKIISKLNPQLGNHLNRPRLTCGKELSYAPTEELKWET